ncbi:DUF2254 domain-containing protein [Alteromonas pelagimontana]|uniref:DUF2254 domain-containing protein n=1 Tax=Alteromonas pelagimontana TaxID=1858656 RepID=A0A6M4MJ29_9ALTE|nr:DUF2254 domain-containing protein [Alteromonas pelagimontana]
MSYSVLTTRIRTWVEGISTSYWFIPVCMMIVTSMFCLVCLTVARRASMPEGMLSLIPLVTQAGAQQLLSTIATAIITATSIVFSMTIVALTMASAQFGPRLLRTFMIDKGTQVVLGTMVSTFLFCIIALHHLSSITENRDALSLLSALAMLLAIIDTFTIVYFIHHIARFIQADEVIYRCFRNLEANLDTLLPRPEGEANELPISEALVSVGFYQTSVKAKRIGYAQSINYSKMLNLESDRITGIEVKARSGDHVMPDATILIIHSTCQLQEETIEELRKFIVIGRQRTPIQDPEFVVSQLVEIALRALSPGINDPFTAITCLDKLTSACILMSHRVFPASCVVNTSSNIWLKRRTFNLHSVIDTSFDQIRQAGKAHVDVALHILHCLSKLKEHFDKEFQEKINEQAKATVELIELERISEKDKREIQEAYTSFTHCPKIF